MAEVYSCQRKVEARLDPHEEIKEEEKKTYFDVHLRFSTQDKSNQIHLTITFDDYDAQRAFYKDYEDRRVVFVCTIKGKEVWIKEKQYVGDFGVAVGLVSELNAIATNMIVKYCYNEKKKFKPLDLKK